MNKLLQNLKHFPSTAVGLLLGAEGLLQSDTVTAAAGANPKLAHYVGTALGIIGALSYIFGVGKKTEG